MENSDLIKNNCLPDEKVEALFHLVKRNPTRKLTVQSLIKNLNDMGEYGARGFSAEQGRRLIRLMSDTYGEMPDGLETFVCNNTFDIWNTNDDEHLDGCFFLSANAARFPQSSDVNMHDVRNWLKRLRYHAFKTYPGFTGEQPSSEETPLVAKQIEATGGVEAVPLPVNEDEQVLPVDEDEQARLYRVFKRKYITQRESEWFSWFRFSGVDFEKMGLAEILNHAQGRGAKQYSGNRSANILQEMGIFDQSKELTQEYSHLPVVAKLPGK